MGQKHLCLFIHVHNAHEMVDVKKSNKMIKLYLRGDKVERAAGLQRNEVRLWFWIVVKVKYVFFFEKEKKLTVTNFFCIIDIWVIVYYDLNWHWAVVLR